MSDEIKYPAQCFQCGTSPYNNVATYKGLLFCGSGCAETYRDTEGHRTLYGMSKAIGQGLMLQGDERNASLSVDVNEVVNQINQGLQWKDQGVLGILQTIEQIVEDKLKEKVRPAKEAMSILKNLYDNIDKVSPEVAKAKLEIAIEMFGLVEDPLKEAEEDPLQELDEYVNEEDMADIPF